VFSLILAHALRHSFASFLAIAPSLYLLSFSLSFAVNLLSPTQFPPHSLFAYFITLAPPPISLPLFLSSLFISLSHTHTHTHPHTHTRVQVSSIRGYGDDHHERLPVPQVRTHWAARHLCTHQSGMITLPSPPSTHHGQSAPFKPGIHDANQRLKVAVRPCERLTEVGRGGCREENVQLCPSVMHVSLV